MQEPEAGPVMGEGLLTEPNSLMGEGLLTSDGRRSPDRAHSASVWRPSAIS